MNGLSTLQEGSTTGDAELIDIRTGYDSHVYGSAGVAIREQVQDLHDSDTNIINNINDIRKSLNVYDFQKVDGFMDRNGNFVNTSDYKSLYVELAVNPGDVIKYKGVSCSQAYGILYYDINDTIIGRVQNNELSTFHPIYYNRYIVPENAVKMKVASFAQNPTEPLLKLLINDNSYIIDSSKIKKYLSVDNPNMNIYHSKGKNLYIKDKCIKGHYGTVSNGSELIFDDTNDYYMSYPLLNVDNFKNGIAISTKTEGITAIRLVYGLNELFEPSPTSIFVTNAVNSFVYTKDEYPNVKYIAFSYYKNRANEIQIEDNNEVTEYKEPVIESELISTWANDISTLNDVTMLSNFFNINNKIDYEIFDGYVNLNGSTGNTESNPLYKHTQFNVYKDEIYKIKCYAYKSIYGYILKYDSLSTDYDKNYIIDNSDTTVYTFEYVLQIKDNGILYVNVYGRYIPEIYKVSNISDFSTLQQKYINTDNINVYNILKGKKWAVCGDSFSYGDFNNAIITNNTITEDGPYKTYKKVYGYIIGNRNDMVIQNLTLGGRTIATPADGSFHNAFSDLSNSNTGHNYTMIDSDVDYITLYFGINDSHHRPRSTGSDGEDQSGIIEIGTINDNTNTTFYGAWNMTLDYLIKNYPFAHIGIIVSNGCETDEYRVATIAVAKKFGIPYIDLNGDEKTPCMLRSTNSAIDSSIRTERTKAMAVNYSGGNSHPSSKAHEYQSYFIENFLRSL